MNYNITARTIPLAANGTTAVDLTGRFLMFYSATGPFTFQIDSNPAQSGFAIIGMDFSRDGANAAQPFTKITLTDTSGSVNNISLIVSMVPITYFQSVQTIFQKDAPTFVHSTPGSTLGAGAFSSVFSGVYTGGQQRKHFILSNNDTTQALTIAESSSSLTGITCPPSQSRIVATSGPLYIINLTAAALTKAYGVSEVFYV